LAYAAMFAWSVYALWSIPVEILPRFDYPQISIIAHDPGAAASEMETLVVRSLEGSCSGSRISSACAAPWVWGRSS
jgi:cobalt-zinc-cadmium resistance protein CzcA